VREARPVAADAVERSKATVLSVFLQGQDAAAPSSAAAPLSAPLQLAQQALMAIGYSMPMAEAERQLFVASGGLPLVLSLLRSPHLQYFAVSALMVLLSGEVGNKYHARTRWMD
jgi:hypothetical protein